MGLSQRLQLHEKLMALSEDYSVYFQPNESTQMQYPCIVYDRDDAYRAAADNKGYIKKQRYVVKLISRDPDNPILDDILDWPLTSYSRGYDADGLNHDVISLYH
jgi:hypothetical protein